jgi:hypothetical protein
VPPDIDKELEDRLREMDSEQFTLFVCQYSLSIGYRIKMKKRWEELTGLFLGADDWCTITDRPPPKEKEEEGD